MEPTPRIIASLLDVLKALGVTQRMVAAQLHVTPGMVSQWRTGFRPIPESHVTALQQLFASTLDQAFDADDWPTRRDRVNRALKTYHHSIVDTLERLSPGQGLRSLYATAEECGRIIAGKTARGAATWSFRERLILGVTAKRFDQTLTLINLLQPLDKRSVDGLERLEEEGNAENVNSAGEL